MAENMGGLRPYDVRVTMPRFDADRGDSKHARLLRFSVFLKLKCNIFRNNNRTRYSRYILNFYRFRMS